MQAVLGWSAIRGAVGLLPMALTMVVLSPLAPRAAQRVGIPAMLASGAFLVGTGLALMAALVDTSNYWSIMPGLMITSLGLAATMTPATTAITGSLPREQQGVASALNDTSREIGGAVGIALLGSIFNAQYRTEVSDVAATLNPTDAEVVRGGIGGAVEVAGNMGSDGQQLLESARQALVDAWTHSMWVGAILAVVTGLAVVGLSVGKRARQDMSAESVLDGDPVDDAEAIEVAERQPEPAGSRAG
jgi:MFS family permease